jgi:hypothetical protein
MAHISAFKSIFTALASILLFTLLHSPKVVDATALTYKIDANEKGCFYAWVDKVGEKIAFYFAVCLSISPSLSAFTWRATYG